MLSPSGSRRRFLGVFWDCDGVRMRGSPGGIDGSGGGGVVGRCSRRLDNAETSPTSEGKLDRRASQRSQQVRVSAATLH